MTEIWKDIPGYEGKYQVSNTGRIKSLGNKTYKSEHFLRYGCAGKSKKYKNVILYDNGKKDFYLVHRLVWESFNGPIPDGMQVNHIDEDPSNNNLDNLNLMTPEENSNWGTGIKRAAAHFSKWVIKLSLNNEILHFYPSTMQAERETGIWHGDISKCCRGKLKQTGGYGWKYAE